MLSDIPFIRCMNKTCTSLNKYCLWPHPWHSPDMWAKCHITGGPTSWHIMDDNWLKCQILPHTYTRYLYIVHLKFVLELPNYRWWRWSCAIIRHFVHFSWCQKSLWNTPRRHITSAHNSCHSIRASYNVYSNYNPGWSSLLINQSIIYMQDQVQTLVKHKQY